MPRPGGTATANSGLWDAPDLLARLVCPACRESIVWNTSGGQCVSCQRLYPIEDGIPILLIDRDDALQDELEHSHDDHKRAQASYFDMQAASDFERDRPHGTPPLHEWLLNRKFLLGTAGISHILPGSAALAVCGGSGMDGEFLAKAGARVITSDISLGAARRAAERATRFGLPLASIVADIESLPMRDRGMDVTYVHDGLHHLASPQIGLAEMVRVADKAVAVTEPAQASLTNVAVRAGVALEFEEAGNRVQRLRKAQIVASLEHAGLSIAEARRYAMFYRHHPGLPTRLWSVPGLTSVARLTLLAAIRLSGDFGNKLTVQGIRTA